MRSKGPCDQKFTAAALTIRCGDVHQAQVFFDVHRDQLVDRWLGDLQAILKQTVQQHPATILLNPFGISTCHEVNGNRIDAMHLLVGIAAAIANRDDQHQQLGVLVGNFRQNLDEGECPVFPRVLLGIGQAVVPRLEFVEQQHRRGVLQQFKDQLVGRDVGFRRAHAFPFALDVGAVRMALEQHIPEKFESLAVQAFANHPHPAAQRDLADLWIAQRRCPGIQPSAGRCCIVHGVVKRCHQVRLAETTLADHDHRTTLVRANGLDPFQEIVGGIGDRQEFLCCNLSRAGVRFVGKLNGCPFEALAPKFVS